MKFKENKNWNNKHQTVKQVVNRLYDVHNRFDDGRRPSSAMARCKNAIVLLQQILKDAEDNGKCVRAVGGGWSLSNIVETHDYLVNTRPLNLIIPNFASSFVEAGVDNENLVFAQCGASIKELNIILEGENKCLLTSGASDGQTIVGAMSTGTHGSAIDIGSMQDFILGLNIITASDEHYWIEGNSRIVTDAFIQSHMPNATRINNSEILNAALVSFGSFGIIHAVLLECDSAYKLQVFSDSKSWDDAKKCIDGPSNFELLNLLPNPYHFEVIINPAKLDSVIVRTMYRENEAFEVIPTETGVEMGIGTDILHVIGSADDFLNNQSGTILRLIDGFIKQSYPDINGKFNAPRIIFGGSENSSDQPAMSLEIGIDANQTSIIVNKILDVATQFPFVGVIALRYIRKSKATLSFAKFSKTCTIEIPGIKSNNTQKFYNKLWERLDADGVDFTFHWGQMNNLNAQNIRKRWSNEAVDAWIEAREEILKTPKQRFMFSNQFIIDCGLTEILV
jgi:hypothetical protein